MKKREILLLVYFICIAHSTFGQKSFFTKLDVDISYSDVDTWRRILYDDPIVIEDNDGLAFGLSTNYHLNEKIFVQFTYRRAELYNIDLASNFKLGLANLSIGRKFGLSNRIAFSPKVGLSIHSAPTYLSSITRGYVDGVLVDEGPIVRSFSGIEQYFFFAFGAEVVYDLTPELGIGVLGEMNTFQSSGSTIISIFLKLRLFR